MIRSSDNWEVENQKIWGRIRDMEGELVTAICPLSAVMC